MKKLQIIAWISFIIGFILKFPHLPGASLLLTLGVFLLLLHSIIFLIKNFKANLTVSFLNLSFSFWTYYLLCRILFWSCGPKILGYSLLFIISVGLTITYIVLYFSKSSSFKAPQILLIAYFLFSIWISFIHSDRIYYFLNLNEITQKENRIENYKAWDKYSWFLYLVDKQDEAIQANLEAQLIIEKRMKIYQNNDLVTDLRIIKEHNQSIRNKSWIDFQ